MVVEFASPSWASTIATCLATFAVLLLFFSHCLRRRRYNLPPGPKPWPIIGNFNLIGPLPHRSLHTLSQKYGLLMHVRLGSKHVVVGSSVDMAKAFLKTHDGTVADRPRFAVGKYTTYNYSDIAFSPYGPYWRQVRRMCKMELFSAKRLDSFEYIRREEVRALMNELFNNAKRIITLKDYLFIQGMNVISRMLLGKKYMDKSHDSIVSPKEFSHIMDEILLLNGVLNIGDYIPWINFLDLQGYIKRMKAVSKKFDVFMEHVLDEHIERMKGIKDYIARDMVDVLLQLVEDPNLEVKLERHGVKALSLDLIAGGTESSAVTVKWAISELLGKPEIFLRATEELDKVIRRDRWVEEKDIVNLPYINAIAKEAMRLHPVAPMLAQRLACEDCNVDGYDIPKGTHVIVNFWTIGRDPEIWENPNEFQPERFIGKEIDVKGHDYELLPFGAGRRMCPGYPLGLKIIQACLANMLHGFNWRLPHNTRKEDLNMEEIFGLSTHRKLPLEVVVEPRLPRHLYSL
ncbi:trimethyltridecatetraene synthase-like [Gastrolobium bilobum]|uniref:trimethyltridecatetraene synthase-like n=1 Tax=Gastrolobium bilobum TaxID=150636 RepID=UPI002AAFE9F4|nr:trimethyltridecatetraene synthase-like [Gastrolobium bilobum]